MRSRHWLLVGVLVLGTATAGCEDIRAKQLLNKATELGSQGHFAEALHYYERLWVQFPDSSHTDEARLKAARIYAGPENKLRSAEDVYRQLILKGASQELRVTALLELAEMYAAREDRIDKAIELLEVYLQRFPGHTDHPQAAIRLAEYYLQRGQVYQAMQEAEPLGDAVGPDLRGRALMVQAQGLELIGDHGAAAEHYAAIEEFTKPGERLWVLALEGRARALEEMDDWRAALAVLQDLREHHPNPDAIERWIVAITERRAEMNR